MRCTIIFDDSQIMRPQPRPFLFPEFCHGCCIRDACPDSDRQSRIFRYICVLLLPRSSPQFANCLRLRLTATRLDVIIAGKYKLSRSQALQLFKSQKVFLNGRVCENNSYQVKEQDIISVRGFGKMEFIRISGETRKGRIYITVLIYV